VTHRIQCLLHGHNWTADGWGPWQHAGRASYYRERHCARCNRHETEEDR
jgi:hypothetical protein